MLLYFPILYAFNAKFGNFAESTKLFDTIFIR